MQIKQLHSSLTVLGLALLAVSSPAAILEYQAVLGNPQTYGGGSSTETVFSPVGATPKLTGTLNSGDQFRIVYSAPAGKKFKIEPKLDGVFSYTLFADWWTSIAVGSTPTAGSSIQFDGLTGSTPTPSEFVFDYDAQGNIRAGAYFPAAEMSFRSITMLFNLPQGISKTFTDYEPFSLSLTVQAFAPERLGPLASLIDDTTPEVPEPATLAVSALALGTLALLRHKRKSAY